VGYLIDALQSVVSALKQLLQALTTVTNSSNYFLTDLTEYLTNHMPLVLKHVSN